MSGFLYLIGYGDTTLWGDTRALWTVFKFYKYLYASKRLLPFWILGWVWITLDVAIVAVGLSLVARPIWLTFVW